MSRSVWIECVPHAVSSGEVTGSRAEERLRELWRIRAPLVVFARDAGDVWDVRALESVDGLRFMAPFVLEHADCPVALRDEYGGTAIMDGVSRCKPEAPA